MYLVKLWIPHVVVGDIDGEGGPDDLVAPLLHIDQTRLTDRLVQLYVGHTHLVCAVLCKPPGQSLGNLNSN